MASQNLTEYERKRLENIKRNAEMVAALQIHSKAATLSAGTKRQRTKSYKASPVKKPKTDEPIVIRQSLRTRGMPPDSKGLADDFCENSDTTPEPISPSKPQSPPVLGPISMLDAFSGDEIGSNRVLVGTILSISKKTQAGDSVKVEFDGVKNIKDENFIDFSKIGTLGSCKTEDEKSSGKQNSVKGVVKKEKFDGLVKIEKHDSWLESMDLKPGNVAQVMAGNIMVVKFFPSSSMRMIAAGNKYGNIAFWNVDSKDKKGDGLYLYRPHSGPISGILIQQHSMSKIYSSCYDGFIRLMDAEKEVFDLVHSCDDTVYSLSQQPNNSASLYFSEGLGGLNVWDIRTGKSSKNWILHESKINTISFNPQNPNIMATSSTDGTACIWDLRNIRTQKPKTLKTVTRSRAIHSAYFSPSGTSLATTSLDNNVGIVSGVNFEDTCMIYHNNRIGRLTSSFRGIWGWDDSYIFIGNKKKGVDVISPGQRRTVMTLQSAQITAVPCRFDAHPYEVGMLAGATGGGLVYLWTPSNQKN